MSAEQRREDGSEPKEFTMSGQALCAHVSPDLSRAKVLVRSENVSCSLNLKKTIINPQNYPALLSNRIPSTIFLPFLSRLQVGTFGGFPCSFQRCTR